MTCGIVLGNGRCNIYRRHQMHIADRRTFVVGNVVFEARPVRTVQYDGPDLRGEKNGEKTRQRQNF